MDFELAIRQGDILFLKIEKVPRNCEKLNTKLIKEGEVSGHCHKINYGNATLYKPSGKSSDNFHLPAEQLIGYLEVTDLAVIGHEEHKPIHLLEGAYAIVQQRTFNPLERGESYGTD